MQTTERKSEWETGVGGISKEMGCEISNWVRVGRRNRLYISRTYCALVLFYRFIVFIYLFVY